VPLPGDGHLESLRPGAAYSHTDPWSPADFTLTAVLHDREGFYIEKRSKPFTIMENLANMLASAEST
jgi:hypothetical protein